MRDTTLLHHADGHAAHERADTRLVAVSKARYPERFERIERVFRLVFITRTRISNDNRKPVSILSRRRADGGCLSAVISQTHSRAGEKRDAHCAGTPDAATVNRQPSPIYKNAFRSYE
jgi:hypothetical protein